MTHHKECSIQNLVPFDNNSINNQTNLITQHIHSITKAINDLQQNQEKIKKEIQEQMDNIIQSAMNRQETLINELHSLYTQKSETLTCQLTKLKQCQASINNPSFDSSNSKDQTLANTKQLLADMDNFTVDACDNIVADIHVDDIVNIISNRGNVAFGEFEDRNCSAAVTWADVGGMEEIKKQIIGMTAYQSEYPHLFAIGQCGGIKAKRGFLLWGPRGCGKTKVVKAAAAEVGVTCIVTTGPELITHSNANFIENVFQKAVQCQPCILFFDQLDALTRSCSYNTRSRIVNKLIVAMDNIKHDKKIWFIGAGTRHIFDPLRKDCMEPLMKEGRFEQLIFVDLPDFPCRVSILKAVLHKTPFNPNTDFEYIAEQTHGYSGSDLYDMAREAIKLFVRTKREAIQSFIDCDELWSETTCDFLMRQCLRDSNSSVSRSEYQKCLVIKQVLHRGNINDIVFDMNEIEIQTSLIWGYIRQNALNMRIPSEIIELILESYILIDLINIDLTNKPMVWMHMTCTNDISDSDDIYD